MATKYNGKSEIFSINVHQTTWFVITQINIHCLRFENEFGIKLNPLGLKNDAFGYSFLKDKNQYIVFGSLSDLRKQLRWELKCGMDLQKKY